MENNFLDNFRNLVIELPKDQCGNFVEKIDEVISAPPVSFLHQLCRKIDIKKILYVAYDDEKDLIHIKNELISDNYWLKIIYILSCFYFKIETDLSVKFKALNTLLKTRDIISSLNEVIKNDFVQRIYNEIN